MTLIDLMMVSKLFDCKTYRPKIEPMYQICELRAPQKGYADGSWITLSEKPYKVMLHKVYTPKKPVVTQPRVFGR